MAAPPRLVFTSHGTWGDVGPMAALAARCERRGARCTFITTPFFEDKLRQRGLDVVAVGARWDPAEGLHDPDLRHPLTGPIHIWRRVFLPLVKPMREAAAAAMEGEEVALSVNHPWCLGGQLAAEQGGRPWVMVSFAPVTWFSAEDVPVLGPIVPPAWLARAIMVGPTRWMFRRFFSRSLDGEAAACGLPVRPDRFFFAPRGAALNLAFWPEVFRPPAADDPPHALLCGFPDSGDPRAALDPALDAFLAAGPPPVVMGLGSALPALAPELYEVAAEACAALGARVVLVGAPAGEAAPGVLRVPWAPYRALFERARLVIHHGGIGTTAESLAAGRPQLVIPFGADQYDNAARVEKLGVGRTCVRDRASASRLRALLGALLNDPALPARAAALAEALNAAPDGLDVAAARLVGDSFTQR